MSAPDIRIHFPLHWFSERQGGRSREALIILNNSMAGVDSIIRKYWNHFSVVACADGGSNLLYDNLHCRTEGYIPHFICGDMDSARDDVLQFFHSKGCSIERNLLQDKTDFTKTLLHLLGLRESGKYQFSKIFVFNGIGGRFDHTIANINTVYRHLSTANVSIYLMSEDTILFPLEPGRCVRHAIKCLETPTHPASPPQHVACIAHAEPSILLNLTINMQPLYNSQGQHTIYTNSNFEEGHCGLIPLGEPCTICTTSGLKWNLDQHEMRFGDLVSTSNLIEGEQVTVSTSNTVLWTMSHTLIRSIQ